MDIIEKINHYDPPTLARLAKCAEPDSRVSEGADFLALVRDKVVDMVQELGEVSTPTERSSRTPPPTSAARPSRV